MRNPVEQFEVGDALRAAAETFWRAFAPIVLAGLLLLTLPTTILVAIGLLNPRDPAVDTLVSTGLGVLGMLFVCIVTYGSLATLVGRPLAVGDFLRGGLRAARPGFVVALVIGAAAVGLSIVQLLVGRVGGLVGFLIVGSAFWLAAVYLPAIPVAIVERRMPFDALRRAAQLTRGCRGRLAGLLIAAVLAVLPGIMIVNSVVFGPGASPTRAEQVLDAMTLASPGLWIVQLFNLLVYGALATIPAVAYAELAGLRRDSSA